MAQGALTDAQMSRSLQDIPLAVQSEVEAKVAADALTGPGAGADVDVERIPAVGTDGSASDEKSGAKASSLKRFFKITGHKKQSQPSATSLEPSERNADEDPDNTLPLSGSGDVGPSSTGKSKLFPLRLGISSKNHPKEQPSSIDINEAPTTSAVTLGSDPGSKHPLRGSISRYLSNVFRHIKSNSSVTARPEIPRVVADDDDDDIEQANELEEEVHFLQVSDDANNDNGNGTSQTDGPKHDDNDEDEIDADVKTIAENVAEGEGIATNVVDPEKDFNASDTLESEPAGN